MPAADARITDGAISADGEWVVLRTHATLIFYRAATFLNGDFKETRRVDLKSFGEPQGEAIAFGPAKTVYVAGEGDEVPTRDVGHAVVHELKILKGCVAGVDGTRASLALMRILVVEDEPNAAHVLAKGLREHAYAVDIASDELSALQQLADTDYDLVILDILLPRINGLDLCRQLRATSARSRC